MPAGNPLPYVGAIMVYKAANGGENINGHDDLACVVTKDMGSTFNIIIFPDAGGALVPKSGITFSPNADHPTGKAGYIHWPIPK